MIRSMLCLVVVFSSNVVAAMDPLIVYAISSRNQVNGESELVRLEDNVIQSRVPLGRGCTFGYSDTQICTISYSGEERRIRCWDIRSGNETSNCAVQEMDLAAPHAMIGAVPGLNIDATGQQILYRGHKEVTVNQVVNGKKFPLKRTVSAFAAIDVATGLAHQIKTMGEPASQALWQTINGKDGIRLSNGAFAVYSPKKHEFETVIEIEAAAADWSFELPGVGLGRWREGSMELLTDEQLFALEEPFSLGQFKTANFRIATPKDGEALILFATTENDATDVVLAELRDRKEIFRQSFPVRTTHSFCAPDSHAWLLLDKRGKEAIYYDRPTDTSHKIDLSFAGVLEVIPYFHAD